MKNLNIILLSLLFNFGLGGTQHAFGQCADDMMAPIIVFPSQDIVVTLDPCDIGGTTIVLFEISVTDDCDGDHFPNTSGVVIPGSEFLVSIFSATGSGAIIALPESDRALACLFPPGTYQILIEAEDAAGNLRQEDFFVIVNQDAPPATNLQCNLEINATLDEGCQRFITSNMVLEGDFGCADEADFHVTIDDDDPSNGNILDGRGPFTYEVAYAGLPQGAGAGTVAVGFTGPYAQSGWTTRTTTRGFIDFTPASLQLGTQAGTGQGVESASALLVIPGFAGSAPGCAVDLSFDFDFAAIDFAGGSAYQLQGYTLDPVSGAVQQVFTLIASDGTTPGPTEGTVNLPINTGQALLLSWVNFNNASPNGGSVTITNWTATYPGSCYPATPNFDWEDCEGTINAEDKTAPDIACRPATVQLSAAGTASVAPTDVFDAAGSSDNCGTVIPQSVNPGSFTCADLGTITAYLTVADGSGNLSTCAATITVSDPNGYCIPMAYFDLRTAVLTAYIENLGLPAAIERALTRRLALASAKFCSGASAAIAINYLNSTISYVQYHRGGSIPAAAADHIIAGIQSLIDAISAGIAQCSTGGRAAPPPGAPGEEIAGACRLGIFPNPFRGEATIRFYLPQAGQATLELFNLQGQCLQRLEDARLDGGSHERTWDARLLAPGAYLLRLRTEDAVLTRKVVWSGN
ncbi:MAG: T9SS type A sorting domain-containing protein [Phaeodactylibacter sp.]|nr:T9SS type A sorting domain-containing protein [Phaeodactylibacter sp.]